MPVLKCISGRKADVSYTVPHPQNHNAQVATPDLYKDATIYRFQHNEEQFVPQTDADFIMRRWPKEFQVLSTSTDTPAQQLLQPQPYDSSTDTDVALRKEKQRNDEFWRTHVYTDGEVVEIAPHSDSFVSAAFDVLNVVTSLLSARTDEELTTEYNYAMKKLTPQQPKKRKPGKAKETK